ncbi:MAG: hypothetical protein QW191_00880 [Conexivisphaerales archaeon]
MAKAKGRERRIARLLQEGAEVQRQKAKGMERCDKSIQLLPTKTWKRTTAQAIQNASLNRFTQTLSYEAESAV